MDDDAYSEDIPLQVATWRNLPAGMKFQVAWEPTERGEELLETYRLLPIVGAPVRLVCEGTTYEGVIASVDPDGKLEIKFPRVVKE